MACKGKHGWIQQHYRGGIRRARTRRPAFFRCLKVLLLHLRRLSHLLWQFVCQGPACISQKATSNLAKQTLQFSAYCLLVSAMCHYWARHNLTGLSRDKPSWTASQCDSVHIGAYHGRGVPYAGIECMCCGLAGRKGNAYGAAASRKKRKTGGMSNKEKQKIKQLPAAARSLKSKQRMAQKHTQLSKSR